MALQIEHGGVGPAAALPGTLVHDPGVGVDVLVLLEEPRVPEHPAAVLAPQDSPVLLLPVFQ